MLGFSLPSHYLRSMALNGEVVGLLAELHGQCLRLLCDDMGKDFCGLSVAARAAGKIGLSGRLVRKLMQIDVAFAVSRHLNSVKASDFVGELRATLPQRAAPEEKATTQTGAVNNKQDKKVVEVAVDGADMGEGAIEVELVDLNRPVVEAAGLVAFGWQKMEEADVAQEKKKLKKTMEEEDGGKAVEGAAGGEVAAGRWWTRRPRRLVVKKTYKTRPKVLYLGRKAEEEARVATEEVAEGVRAMARARARAGRE